MTGVLMACLEALAFSSLLAGGVAACLTFAAGVALDSASPITAGLAFAGTLVVYNVDRLRDLERDRFASPRRSAFVDQQRGRLIGLVILAAAAAIALTLRAGLAAAVLCAAVLVPSLLHRRIKRHPVPKAVYVTLAWVAILVGLPALQAASQASGVGPTSVLLIASIYAAAIGANLVASNVRDGHKLGRADRAIGYARGLAVCGIAIAVASPGAIQPLACVPLAQLASLTGFRRGERSRLILIDGSLLIGGLSALLLQISQ